MSDQSLSPADAAVVNIAKRALLAELVDAAGEPRSTLGTSEESAVVGMYRDAVDEVFVPVKALVVAARAETAKRDEALAVVGVECVDGEWGFTSEPHGLQPSSDGTLVEALREQMEVGRTEDAAALAAMTRERDALAGYAAHRLDCVTEGTGRDKDCTCGLEAALRAAGGDGGK